MDKISVFDTSPLKLNAKFIVILAMLYVTASVAADAVAFRFDLIGGLIESGATIIFPITYILGDVITEVYGYPTARKLIWYGLFCELVFALLIKLVIALPYSHEIPYQTEYKDIFSPILRFVASGIVGDIASSFVNIYVISKFKIFLKGRGFVLRSIGATALGELVMNIIVCLLAFTSIASIMTVIKIIFSAYLLEMIYAVIFVFPAWALILILKRMENKDAYDYNVNYNIFKLD
jgi:queuosine precursor transporter